MIDPIEMGGGPNSADAGPGPRLKCLHCSDVIQSFYRHDFKYCSCKSIHIDGGKVYTKYGCMPNARFVWIDREEQLNAALVGSRDTSDDKTWCHNCGQLVLVSSTEKRPVEFGGIEHTWLEEKDFCKVSCQKKDK